VSTKLSYGTRYLPVHHHDLPVKSTGRVWGAEGTGITGMMSGIIGRRHFNFKLKLKLPVGLRTRRSPRHQT
jgi:hypothetical protein